MVIYSFECITVQDVRQTLCASETAFHILPSLKICKDYFWGTESNNIRMTRPVEIALDSLLWLYVSFLVQSKVAF